MDEKAFVISLTVDEGRTVFEALAEQPFKYVFELIGNINNQANEAIDRSDKDTPTTYTFTGQELKLIVQALAKMPFEQVYGLITSLNGQIRAQAGAVSFVNDSRRPEDQGWPSTFHYSNSGAKCR
jgi:hypothetical protein